MVVSDSGFTVSDILENDFETIVSIISAKHQEQAEEKEEAMSLGDFMKKL
ncbi:hypothetical protein ACFO26_06895 [Lactococcus nasutitermitis]|uniref:Uncharacterized protein n=1 Tax=Lactococcus nasutitermitis TaxID=1652957 RepID=A0ABV9JD82_9LACT|nr:hypothetical protein [Lactococcus nasutitermitis]